ncbi:hypothetical protein EAG_07853 [Camponotus floridanus]|uniref:Uncharacterized protein n=1 Tax=Camponotus floridanus TaxID=104421 RepID=E1ZXM1_CAMFO|nr:hypothetical protein EAG_07853 [Camponotus floridanus]
MFLQQKHSIRQVSQVGIRDAKLLSTQDDTLADTRHDEDERVPGQPAALYDAFIARLYAAFESPSDAEDGRSLATLFKPPLMRLPDWSAIDVT